MKHHFQNFFRSVPLFGAVVSLLLLPAVIATTVFAQDPAFLNRLDATQIEVQVEGHSGFLLQPRNPAANGRKPWAWYAPVLQGKLPRPVNTALFTWLLGNGFAIGGVDVGESFGNPAGRKVYTEFYRLLVTKYGLSSKPCLLPQSRGGLMLFNWAAEHPESVGRIAAVFPVGDLRSFPGLARASKAYGMSETELREQLSSHNPIDRLAPLANAKIPILLLHGDADTLVPLEPNGLEIARRYKALGGPIELIVLKGKAHAEIPEFFESERLLDFCVSSEEGGMYP